MIVQQSTNVTMKKRLYDIRWYQPKDRYGIELFDEHKFSFSGRAIVILLEAVLTNANLAERSFHPFNGIKLLCVRHVRQQG